MAVAARAPVSSQPAGHNSSASIASTATTGSRRSSMRRFSHLFSLKKKSRRSSTDTTTTTTTTTNTANRSPSPPPPAPLPSMLSRPAPKASPADSQAPNARPPPPSAFNHPLNKGAYTNRNGSVDSVTSGPSLGRGGSVNRQSSIKFAKLPQRPASVSAPAAATPPPTAPPTAVAPSTESVSTSQTFQTTSSAQVSSATSGGAHEQAPALSPPELFEFAQKHGFNPQDPNLPMYARLQAAADAAILAHENGAADHSEAEPGPVIAREPTPPPPPRPPSPDPVVAPALARLVAAVPIMTHTVLRYARSNTGTVIEATDGDPVRNASSELAMATASFGLGGLGRAFRGKRPREQRTFARGLAAVMSSSAPLVLATLVHYLGADDLVALECTCRTIRATLRSALGQELVLHRFLGPVGYETWPAQARALHVAVAAGAGGAALLSRPRVGGSDADPVPLTTADVWHYILSHDLRSEYLPLGQLVTRHGQQQIDQRWVQLAQRTTQAHNRVLARLRAQGHWDPSGAAGRDLSRVGAMAPYIVVARTGPLAQGGRSTVSRSSTGLSLSAAKGDLIPPLAIDREAGVSERAIHAWEQMGLKRRFAEARAWEMASKTLGSSVRCPLRATDRAPIWRVFVPSSNPAGWLEDAELARAEAELTQTGIRGHAAADHLMAAGDVVWDVALGAERNEGKFIYDGTFVRDLSFTFDPWGHLPSWMDTMSYPVGWYQGVIKSSASPRPVVFLDVLPYRDELMESLVLARRVVQGDKYAMHKWIATATAPIGPKSAYRTPVGTDGPTSLRMVQQVSRVHPSWYGQLELQVDGTAECLHDLIVRCIGPWAPPGETKTLLQAVLNPHSTVADRLLPPLRLPPVPPGKHAPSYAFPFHILRNRCKPGTVVLQPIAVAEPPRA